MYTTESYAEFEDAISDILEFEEGLTDYYQDDIDAAVLAYQDALELLVISTELKLDELTNIVVDEKFSMMVHLNSKENYEDAYYKLENLKTPSDDAEITITSGEANLLDEDAKLDITLEAADSSYTASTTLEVEVNEAGDYSAN